MWLFMLCLDQCHTLSFSDVTEMLWGRDPKCNGVNLIFKCTLMVGICLPMQSIDLKETVWIPNIYMQIFLDSRNTKDSLWKHTLLCFTNKGTQVIEEAAPRHGQHNWYTWTLLNHSPQTKLGPLWELQSWNTIFYSWPKNLGLGKNRRQSRD